MRGRITVGTLCAALLCGLLAAESKAQTSRRVKITRGPAIAAPGDISASDGAAQTAESELNEPARPNRLLSSNEASPVELRANLSAAAPAELTSYDNEPVGYSPDSADTYSMAKPGSGFVDEAKWGTVSPTPDDISSETPSFGEPTSLGESTNCGCDSCGAGDCSVDCSGCDACCDSCGRPYGLYAGAEATYLRPNYSNTNPALDAGSNFGYVAAPRLWLGWQGESGWGIRGRYWDLDANTQLHGAFSDVDAAGAQTFVENLGVYAVDLELTRRFWFDNIEWCASVGARTGRLHHGQALDLSVFGLAGGGADDASVILHQVDRNLNGTGLTLAIGARRPFIDSRLALFCNLRGSVIWGKNAMNVSTTVVEAVPVGAGDLDLNDFQTITRYGSNGDGMWIGEIQAGGEWDTPINNAFGAGNAFIRVMFEGQWWQLPGVTVAGYGSTVDQFYEFLGVTAAIGFTR